MNFFANKRDTALNSMEQLKNSKIYRDFVSDEQLWTNFKLMEVYDQMGQFVSNRYPFNSTAAQKWPKQHVE